jgi:hypothetical protein
MDLPPVPYMMVSYGRYRVENGQAYVATGEVTSLEHELRDDAVESRASISETLLAGAKSTEVLSSLWDYIIVEVEVDAAFLLCRERLLAVLRYEVDVG